MTGGFAPASNPAPASKPTAKPTPAFDATEATGGFQAPSPPVPKPAAKSAKAAPEFERTFAASGAAQSSYDPSEQTAIEEPPSPSGRDDRTMAHPSSADEGAEDTRHGKAPSDDEIEMPDKLGGYEVVKELGRGGMGAVYLARQVSLDRPVALKVMNARWASDPIFLARFTREAYAAAQLVHHNVVQIYDIGEDKGVNFFSMEFVEGRSLGDVVKKGGKLAPETAVGYTLQAARGLKFAHDRGMIHRDVKPDNLMLNSEGIVKVADLGLVKTPSMSAEDDALPGAKEDSDFSKTRKTKVGLASLPAGMTHAHSAMGSPAYMSPEQCRDAANVDQRADIYSLGCSLFVLLTGQTPFKGNTAFEVMSKHAVEAPPSPNQVVKSVPPDLSTVVLHMLEKDPSKRYQNMDELIRDLEKFVGGKGSGYKPSEENLDSLEGFVERFNKCSMANIRKRLVQVFVAGSLLGAAVSLFVSATAAVGLIGMLVQGCLAYFIVSGISEKTPLFRKTRELVFGARFTDWLTWLFGASLFLLLLFLTGTLWAWLGFGVIGVILALGLHFLIDRTVAKQRQAAITDCQNMFKRMRLQGCEEEMLRTFVAQNSGRSWEELFEALFGFEAKLAARSGLNPEEAAGRARFAAWREPILRAIDRVLAARREARERKHLQAIEAKKLQAEGMDRKDAEDQAEAAAAQLVENAAVIKAAERAPAGSKTRADGADETVAHAPQVDIKKMLEAAEKPPKKLPKPPAQPVKHFFKMLVGWKLRFVVGSLLIVGGVLWIQQNLNPEVIQEATSATQVRDLHAAKEEGEKLLNLVKSMANPEVVWSPLKLKLLPDELGLLFNHINPLVAGLILIVSIFFSGILRAMLFTLAAAVAFLGDKFGVIPEVGPLQPYQLSLIGGTVLALLAMFLVKRKDD